MCVKCGTDGGLDFFLACHVNSGNDVTVVVGHDLFNDIASENFFTVDDARDLENFIGLSLQFYFKSGALSTSGEVSENGFVDRRWWHWYAVDHDALSQ